MFSTLGSEVAQGGTASLPVLTTARRIQATLQKLKKQDPLPQQLIDIKIFCLYGRVGPCLARKELASGCHSKEMGSIPTASHLCISHSKVNPNSTYECLDVQNEAHAEHPRANPIGKQVKGFHSKTKLETPRETNA